MRFLVDNPVSPLGAEMLRKSGRDAVHIRDYRLQAAAEPVIFERASQEGRIIVTADTDFGSLAARSKKRIFRRSLMADIGRFPAGAGNE